MNLIQSSLNLVRENKKSYLTLNILYYGLVAVFMGVVAFMPEVQNQLLATVGSSFNSGPLAYVGQAYVNAELLKAVALTFLVNLFMASLLYITLPSLIIPFSGLLLGVSRAIIWGLLFSPVNPDLRLLMIPHSLTLILEGQAYILVMFGAFLQGKAFLWPKSAGVEGHGRGYIEGLKRSGKIYILVIITLLISAIYEVLEVVLMSKLMG